MMMMGILEFLLFIICCGLVAVLGIVLYVLYTTEPDEKNRQIPSFPGEDTFGNEGQHFPSIFDEASKEISVIIPAYNEEDRLPSMLDECIQYLEENFGEGGKKGGPPPYEIIVVDDGSKDQTSQTAQVYGDKLGSDKFRVLKLAKNRGKGGAVRMGVLRCRGKRILFADADGATTFSELKKMETKIKEDEVDLVCGSRAHMEKESIAQRSPFRTLLMKGFHICVYLFGSKTVNDTQCGFKLMTRDFAKLAFMNMHIERWAFDVELIKIGEMSNYKIAEIPVKWTEIDGSKLDPLSASIQMLKDLFFLWLRYSLKLWTVKNISPDDKKRL